MHNLKLLQEALMPVSALDLGGSLQTILALRKKWNEMKPQFQVKEQTDDLGEWKRMKSCSVEAHLINFNRLMNYNFLKNKSIAFLKVHVSDTFFFLFKCNVLYWMICKHSGYKRTLIYSYLQFSSVHSLIHVRLFVTPWIAARQASLSITNSQSSLKLTSI